MDWHVSNQLVGIEAACGTQPGANVKKRIELLGRNRQGLTKITLDLDAEPFIVIRRIIGMCAAYNFAPPCRTQRSVAPFHDDAPPADSKMLPGVRPPPAHVIPLSSPSQLKRCLHFQVTRLRSAVSVLRVVKYNSTRSEERRVGE